MKIVLVSWLFSMFSTVALFIHDHDSELTDVPKLSIIIFYEALNPYCKLFIRNQLYPSMAKGRLNVTNLVMLPFGKARMDSNGHITCRYGEAECQRNALHACILNHNDMEEALELIACLMEDDRNIIEECVPEDNHINVTNARNCFESLTVDKILLNYAEESAEWPYHYMPAVAVDNQFNIDAQEDFTEHFDKAFCAKYKNKFNIKLDNCY